MGDPVAVGAVTTPVLAMVDDATPDETATEETAAEETAAEETVAKVDELGQA